MAATKTTRLQAINAMLSAAGEAPVANLDDNGGLDSQMAEAVLDETLRSVLATGWFFNTRKVTFNPVGGECAVPDAVIRLDMNDRGQTNYTIRGGKIFNLDTGSSSDFTSAVEAEVVELLEWDDIPQSGRNYILKKAARIYTGRTVSDPTLTRSAAQDEMEALAELQRHEMAAGNYRIYTPSQQAIVDRAKPLDWLY